MRTAGIGDFSSSPVVIEWVDRAERVLRIMPALDELLPGRIVMGLGTGLPLRLKQMGIPYQPDSAVERVSATMDELRSLWAGERLPSATPGLPPIQPMFPPAHRIPLVIAAYRREFVALAGQKADGYLARPAESIPSLHGILERLRTSAEDAGRDPDAIESAGERVFPPDGEGAAAAAPGGSPPYSSSSIWQPFRFGTPEEPTTRRTDSPASSVRYTTVQTRPRAHPHDRQFREAWRLP